MSWDCKKISLLISAIILLPLMTSCRVYRPPVPPVIVPGVTNHYERPRVRVKHHRYRYFPAAQVYFDGSRNIYFYLSDNVWLSAPLLPPQIYIDMNNYVTVELEGRKPHLHHKKNIRRYPPEVWKKKRRHKVKKKERRERWEDKKERQKEKLERKKRRLDKKEQDLERREKKVERKEDKRSRQKEYREDRKERRKEYREEEKKRRDDKKDKRKEYREDEKKRRDDKKDKRKKYREDEEEQEDNNKDRRKDYNEDEESEEGGWRTPRKAIWK